MAISGICISNCVVIKACVYQCYNNDAGTTSWTIFIYDHFVFTQGIILFTHQNTTFNIPLLHELLIN